MQAKSYATLKRKLDAIFSEYVRKSSADQFGNARCVSCGAVKPWRALQAGHFVSRVRLATRWDLMNTHPQCSKCNVLLRGNAAGYSLYLVKKYGPWVLDDLDARSRKPVKFTRADLNALIEVYKANFKNLP